MIEGDRVTVCSAKVPGLSVGQPATYVRSSDRGGMHQIVLDQPGASRLRRVWVCAGDIELVNAA